MVRFVTRIVCLIFALTMGAKFGHSNAQESIGLKSYAQAREESARKNAPLMIVFSTDNCIWCKHLENRTLKDPQVQSRIQKSWVIHYSNAGVEKALAEALKVRQFPTLVFASAEGKILGFLEGFIEASALIQNMDQFLASAGKQKEDLQKDSVKAEKGVEENSKIETKHPMVSLKVIVNDIREDFRAERYLNCLEKCEVAARLFPYHTEVKELAALGDEIRKDPSRMKLVADQLTDHLGAVHIALADSLIKKGQPQQAVHYLEKTVEMFGGTRWGEAAQVRLAQLQAPALKKLETQK